MDSECIGLVADDKKLADVVRECDHKGKPRVTLNAITVNQQPP